MKQLQFDPLNLVICGIGGQGNVLASEIVGSALNDLGYRVAIGETYGASQRGGSVMSHVRVSSQLETGVLIPMGQAHIILGFEPLETLRMARKYSNPHTIIVYDPRPVYPVGVLLGEQAYPAADVLATEIASLSAAAYAVPAADIAMEAGDSRAANIALLGALSELPVSPLDVSTLEGILTQRFHGKVLALNQSAFAMGRAAVRQAAGKGSGNA